MTAIEEILKASGAPRKIKSREMPDGLSLMDIAAHRADQEGTVLLMSGGRQDCAKHHIIGMSPWLSLKSRGRDLQLNLDGQNYRLFMDPLDCLRAIMDCFRCRPENLPPTPLASGLMG